MFIFRHLPIFYETPGGAATAGAPSGTETAPPPSTGPSNTPPSEQEPTDSGFWGRFPNVPEDQRAALEPHLKAVQGYVTRMEQAYVAPWKGYTPAQVQGFANFARNFDAQPLQSFLGLAQHLQQSGVIHDDLDLEALAAVVQGQDPPDPAAGGDPNDLNAGVQPVDDWETAPQWAKDLKAREDAREQQEQQRQRAQQEAREDAVLDGQLKLIKDNLKKSGFPAQLVDSKDFDKELTARLITHGGVMEAVINSLSGMRTALLQGAIPNNGNGNGNGEVTLPRGVPPGAHDTATGRRARQRPSDSFAKASAGAEQFIIKSNRAQSQ